MSYIITKCNQSSICSGNQIAKKQKTVPSWQMGTV